MIDVRERPTSTYDAVTVPVHGFRNLYTGLFRSIAANNSTAILYDFMDESLNGQIDPVATSGSYPPFPFWTLPIDTGLIQKAEKLSLKQAQDLALKVLASAEERRKREREAEAEYWADLSSEHDI